VVLGLPFECAENALPGLEIMIKLPLVSTDNACDAVVTAKDEYFSETLQILRSSGSHQCVFGGVTEREGNYDVNVSLEGYQPQLLEYLYVWQGQCHVNTTRRLVRLEKAN
jgi:hypothetical protein